MCSVMSNLSLLNNNNDNGDDDDDDDDDDKYILQERNTACKSSKIQRDCEKLPR